MDVPTSNNDTKGALTCIINNVQTRTSLDSDLKVVWNSGDKIMLFSESSPSGEEYETSDDGTTTGAFNPTGNSVKGDVRYAIYPSTVVSGATMSEKSVEIDFSALMDQTYSAELGETTTVSSLPMVSSSSDTSFVFENICGGVKFQINEYQGLSLMINSIEVTALGGEQISGKATYDFASDSLILASSGDNNSVKVTSSGGVNISTDGVLSESRSFVVFLPAGTYSEGFTFCLTDEDGRQYIKKAAGPITVKAGVVTPLSPLCLTLYYGTANCIVTSSSGTLSIDVTPYYVFGTDFVHEGIVASDSEGNPAGCATSAAVLWQQVEKNASGNVVGTPSISGTTLSVPVTGTKGNAVVTIKDSDGVVLWSYHIWVSDVSDVSYSNESRGTFQMMDRNLGATSTTLKDRNTYGCFYQWGRKDPFPRDLNAERPSGSPYKNEGAETLTGTTDSDATTGTIGWSVRNPGTRLLSSSNWHYAGDIPQLWGNSEGTADEGVGTKTVYDPCPEGYRVADPSCFNNGWTFNKTYCNSNYGYTFKTDDSSTSTFTTGGDLMKNANGIEFLEYRGYLWTNSPVAYRFYYNNASVKVDASGLVFANGAGVRCVKE